jgi:hypothetical protein
MANARDIVNRIRGNIIRLRTENFPLGQEIGIIKQTEEFARELINMLGGGDAQHAKDLFHDLEKYRKLYLEEYQALEKKGTLNATKLDAERKRVMGLAVEHLNEISA